MHNFLLTIAAKRRQRISEAKLDLPYETLLERAYASRQPFSVVPRFAETFGVIAELKKASPTLGTISSSFNPSAIAGEYLQNGATMLSILTEPDYFQGDLATLAQVRANFPESVLLMKDFVLERYQVAQARAFGADAVLLIVALLSDDVLLDLFSFSASLGLTPLVEVHDEEDLERAIKIGAYFVGVNNRSLKTLEVDLATSHRLVSRLRPNMVAISESGISEGKDLQRLREAGYHGALIGTSLMSAPQPGTKLKELLGALQ
jgi:indole-3-glycerol phosphate synthase